MKEKGIRKIQLLMRSSLWILFVGSLCRQTEKYKKLKADYLCLHIQNAYLKSRGRELDRQQRQLRIVRHEMINDYILEMGYLEKGLYQELKEHYRKKTGYFDTEGKRRLVDTGNVGMDAILNYKLLEADQGGISVDFEHQISGRIEIADADLNTVIGNLMNNAMEAVRQLELEERNIILRIRADKTTFFLEIRNSYQGIPKKGRRDKYLTQKEDRKFHGLGLLQVKRVVHKYDGKVEIEDKNGCFDVRLLLYM